MILFFKYCKLDWDFFKKKICKIKYLEVYPIIYQEITYQHIISYQICRFSPTSKCFKYKIYDI